MLENQIETHPFTPFLPENAKLLMLGSFPPSRERWKMEFYYPNFQNDMWRIFGLIFFENKNYFLDMDKKSFNETLICEFLVDKGIAIYESAETDRTARRCNCWNYSLRAATVTNSG